MKTFKQMQLCSIILAVVGLSMSLTSCQKNEDANNPGGSINSSTSNVTLGATINPPTTKGELNGTAFTWCSGDQLQVYDGPTASTSLDSTTFDIVEQETFTNNAFFTGTVEDWDAAFDFYLVYPVSTVDASSSEATSSTSTYDSSTSTLKLTLPCNQIQKYDADGNIDPEMTDKYDYKMGIIKAEEKTDNVENTTLSNLMTLVDVNITKSAEMQITKVVIRSNNDLFPTEYDYNVETSTGEYVNKTDAFTLSLLDADSNAYTSSGTSLQARFLMCPFSVAATDGFYVDVYTADKIYTLNKTGLAMDFAAGVENHTSMTLDASGEVTETANCYIIAPDNSLKIPVNVRGNGVEVDGTGISASISPSSVGILWQTSPDLISLSDMTTDEKVTINANSTAGNAVIAAYDGDGDILWSWHIWVTDYDPDNGGTSYTIENSADSSYTFMDRNLGATTATPGDVSTLGLLYQWGRKDPFPGSASTSTNTEPTIYNASGTGSTSMISSKSSSSLDNAIKNPLIFYQGSDWCSTSNDAFWGGADISSPSEKTMFDPSPAGWRVPTWKGSASPWSEFSTTTFTWNDSGPGRTYTDGSFYPATGFRYSHKGTLDSVGSYGRCWSGSPSETTRAYYLHFTYYVIYSRIHTNFRGYGFPVRCVKE